MADAGSRTYALADAAHPSTSIAGVTRMTVTLTPVNKTNPGSAASVGRQGSMQTYADIVVDLYGHDYTALLSLIGAASANLVATSIGEEGQADTPTLKNVKFIQCVGSITIPEKDSGGTIPEFCVRGRCLWGASDTVSTMWTE